MKSKKIKVYIASPYTKGDVARNVFKALDMADILLDYGFVPFSPLLTHFQHIMFPRDYQEWLSYDMEWLNVCDCLLRLPGESNGADLEVAKAKEIGLPVFYELKDLLKHYGVVA